jgi:signal transduction histidine kinase
MVNYVERVLSGAIGPISTKMIIGSLADQHPISMGEVLDILKENQQTMQLNKELKKKSIELKKATEALQFANEQLTKLDEQKDEFLYTVTHELRTPLTSIRALSEVIYDNPDLDDQQREKYLGVIIKETERMTLLISEVLNLEKYDSGKQKLYLESIDLVELIDQLEQSFLTILSNKQLTLTKIIPNNMFLVRVDKERINQVFYNLISNAIKYAKSNITIRLSDNYNEVIVSIIDDGPGIPDDQKELVFDKFYQVKNKKLQKPDGSGLGLAISKKIIELHEKKIWIENNIPNGTNFSFNLELI